MMARTKAQRIEAADTSADVHLLHFGEENGVVRDKLLVYTVAGRGGGTRIRTADSSLAAVRAMLEDALEAIDPECEDDDESEDDDE